MPTEAIMQHALVTLAALAAAAAIVSRVLGLVGTRTRQTGCSCPSGDGACGSPGRVTSATVNGATVHHVTVLTGQRSARSPAPPA